VSVFDIVWIAVIILWILRSVSRAGGGAGSAGGTDVLPSEAEGEGASQASQAGRADWRERLVEAAREWELEQRRRAGEPVETTPKEAQPSTPAQVELPQATVPMPRQAAPPAPRRAAPPEKRRRSSVLVRDMTPDRVESGLAEMERRVPAAEETTSRRLREEAVPEVVATPIEPRPRRSTGHPAALARLERYSPLRRAILYTEIFGPPKALSETDERLET
jgi:hypothetical protein